MKKALLVPLLSFMIEPSASVSKAALQETSARHLILQDITFDWIDDMFDRFDWISSQALLAVWDSCSQDSDESEFVSVFEDPVEFGEIIIIDDACSETEEEIVQQAFDDFKKCAKFDLLSFLKYLPDAMAGKELKCMFGSFALSDQTSLLIDRPTLSQPCAEALLVHSPFGDLIRAILLYPDKILPCFDQFSRQVPDCNSKLTRVIPMSGPWLRLVTCTVGNAGGIVESFCAQELYYLNETLPKKYVPTTCDRVEPGDSLLLALPEPLLTAPMPDACVRFAKENSDDFNDTVSRYTTFQDRCVSEWEGWTEASTYVSSTSSVSPETTSSGGGTGYPPSSIAWAFFGGMAAGFFLLGLFAFLGRRNNKVETTPPTPAAARSSTSFNCEDGQLDEVQFT